MPTKAIQPDLEPIGQPLAIYVLIGGDAPGRSSVETTAGGTLAHALGRLNRARQWPSRQQMTRRVEWGSAGDEYRYGLRDLTFNSKPIINNLTLFAQDHVSSAPALARVLTDHLMTCPPEYKLPALYLIDSIVKNIGEPYIALLSALLPTAFPAAFSQLGDERTRRDFGRTLETWWNVFSPAVIQEIQQRSFTGQPASMGARKMGTATGSRSVRPHVGMERRDAPPMATHPAAGSAAPYGHLPQFARHAITYELPDIILRLVTDLRAAMLVPPERYNEKLVADIMYRLEYECRADPLLFRALDERARIPDKRPLIDLIDALLASRRGGIVPQQPAMAATALPPRSHFYSAPPRPPPPSASSSAATPPLDFTMLPDVSPLLASLSSLPLNFNLPGGGGATVRPVYEDIIKKSPTAHQTLYARLPRQCTNCGLRFPDTAEGQKKLDAHLDAHFRRNIRLKDKAKKVLARLWMQNEQDWIKSVESSESEQPVVLFASGGAHAAAASIDREQPKSMVRAGADHADRDCRLCQEKITIVWDDEADEWMYEDAIVTDDKEIVHASCLSK